MDGIASVATPHYAWESLREFLLEERIVRPPLPTEQLDVDRSIEVIEDVNRRIATLWPEHKDILVWQNAALRRSLAASYQQSHDLIATAGPLRYGLRPEGERWEWCLFVTVARNYERVSLDPEELLYDADRGGLPEDWLSHSDRAQVLNAASLQNA